MRRALGSGGGPLSTSAPHDSSVMLVHSPVEKLHGYLHTDKPTPRSRSTLGLGKSQSHRGFHHHNERVSPTAASSTASSTASARFSNGPGSDERMSSRSRSSSSYPAAVVDLSAERRQMLVDFVDRSVDDAYNLCHGFGSLRWHASKTREGVSIYRAKSSDGLADDPRLEASVRGKCNVSASFEEMMDTLVTETSADFIAHESAANPAEFLDGQVLTTLVPRTRSDRFVCVKWHCIKSLAPSVAKHRDYIYVEVVDHFTDRDGRKVGFRLSKSVELDELQMAMDSAGIFVRGRTLTLHTFSQVSPGNVELYTMMINDLGERLPTWLVHKIVDTAAMRSACLRDYINQKRLDLLVLARPKEMVPLHKRVCCVVCTRSFSLVRKKYNCVACGEVMCNQCSVHQFVAPPTGAISDFVGKKKARICVQCSSNAQRRQLPRRSSSARASLGSASSTSSTRSKTSSTLGLNETDHRRMTGSTISTAVNGHPHFPPHPNGLNRIKRSASTVETASSNETLHRDENGRVFLTTTTANGTRTSIPHMFQFRVAKNNSTVLSNGRPSSIRSSGMSTSRSSSSPDDDTLLHTDAGGSGQDRDDDDQEDADDDDQEYMIPGDAELEAMVNDDLDFDNLLDATALDRRSGVARLSMDDVGLDLYRRSTAGVLSTDVSEDELTDAEDDETITLPSTGSNGSGGVATLSPSPSSNPLGAADDADGDNDELVGLIIHELAPQTSFLHENTTLTPSSAPLTTQVTNDIDDDDDFDVPIVKPLVVKQFRKRPAPGASSRSIAAGTENSSITAAGSDDAPSRSATPPLPAARTSLKAPPLPPSRSARDAVVEKIVTRSRVESLVLSEGSDIEDPTELEKLDTVQLDGLQAHLDRMTMISESLKHLHDAVESPVKKVRPSVASMEDQYATISNIGQRAQEEAALAAGYAQAILDEIHAQKAQQQIAAFDTPLSEDDDDEEYDPIDLSGSGDVHLVREDGSFSTFLVDSSFTDIHNSLPEGSIAVPGWVTVHSKTMGKYYYYNASCGTTSWTVPTPDTNRKSPNYMVL